MLFLILFFPSPLYFKSISKFYLVLSSKHIAHLPFYCYHFNSNHNHLLPGILSTFSSTLTPIISISSLVSRITLRSFPLENNKPFLLTLPSTLHLTHYFLTTLVFILIEDKQTCSFPRVFYHMLFLEYKLH